MTAEELVAYNNGFIIGLISKGVMPTPEDTPVTLELLGTDQAQL